MDWTWLLIGLGFAVTVGTLWVVWRLLGRVQTIDPWERWP